MRMAFEIAVALALEHGRVVVPSSYSEPWDRLLQIYSSFGDLPVDIHGSPNTGRSCTPHGKNFAETISHLDESCPNWRLGQEGRLFANMYLRFPQYSNIIKNNMRMGDNVTKASLDKMGAHGLISGEFDAIHIRLGDFLLHSSRKDRVGQLATALSMHSLGPRVLVISDAPLPPEIEKSLGNPSHLVVFLPTEDLYGTRNTCKRNARIRNEFDTVVDMLCCTHARSFWGSDGSTVSSTIISWRGGRDNKWILGPTPPPYCRVPMR